MLDWVPQFAAVAVFVMLAASLDTLHAIRRDLARLRREHAALRAAGPEREAA